MPGIIKCFNNSCIAYNDSETNNCSKPLTKSDIQACPEGIILGDQDPKPQSYYVQILASPVCACPKHRGKQRGYAFCYQCYDTLPKFEKSQLYNKLGEGFEKAYDNARFYLEKDVW